MKNKYGLLILLAVTVLSCKNNNDKSDAYGNFEATEIIVSAQSNGKLIAFEIVEGEILKNGTSYGFVDTTDLFLKKQQLLAQKNAVSSKIKNITAQIEVLQQQKQNLETDKDRIVKMNKDGAASKKQLDDVVGGIDVINKQINSIQTQSSSVLNEIDGIQKQVEQISSAIGKSYILDETGGTVLVKYAEQGEVTAFGKPLYKVANLNNSFSYWQQFLNLMYHSYVSIIVASNRRRKPSLFDSSIVESGLSVPQFASSVSAMGLSFSQPFLCFSI